MINFNNQARQISSLESDPHHIHIRLDSGHRQEDRQEQEDHQAHQFMYVFHYTSTYLFATSNVLSVAASFFLFSMMLPVGAVGIIARSLVVFLSLLLC